ncbi:hypothetical protein [Thermocrinis sp.]
MIDKLLLSLYMGALFCIVFIVAPILLRTDKSKNLAGHFYGKMLWRFYKLAFLILILYLLLADENRVYALPLMAGLTLNIALSLYLKDLKRTIGDIDLIPYNDKTRVKFRRLSILSTLILFANFALSILVYIKISGGVNGL